MDNIINIEYSQTGAATNTDMLGMREMQSLVYSHRNSRHLLVKAPPASGKSRAMMFVALDKLANQGIRKVIVAVPQQNIGRSFRDTQLKKYGFYEDWKVAPAYNLCDSKSSDLKKSETVGEFLRNKSVHTLVCTHSTLLSAMASMKDEELTGIFFGIDEFHHGSADEGNRLGSLIRRLLNNTDSHILAMTGSYFRGDSVPVMRPEDEMRFKTVTYTYYQQLNGYKYLKSLGIGYQFFQGKYISAIPDTLDTSKKTLIHIPNVNSKTAYANKYDQVEDIIKCIGTVVDEDLYNFIHIVKTSDGRVLKVADLVEDDETKRTVLQNYLQRMDSRDALDILIALGTAKEGFDWEWCECCLTVGIRASLTEVVQIIGRCTRDCEGKTHAQFTNLIPCPDAAQDDVSMAVNDMIKAISVSLLMEQVMSPKWNFRTKTEGKSEKENQDKPSKPKHTIEIYDLEPPTERVQEIVDNDITELKATLFSHDIIRQALAKDQIAEVITQSLIPKIIEQRYPQLSGEELEQLRQQTVASLVLQNPDIKDDGGNRFIRIANKFVNINDLSINLIDSINPFQRAYEIMSKSLTPKVLAGIQGEIESVRSEMTKEEAIILFRKYLPIWRQEHGNRIPDIAESDSLGHRIAVAIEFLKKLKQTMQ